MITLQKIGDAIKFTFSGNTHYLQDGTVEVPVNSLSLTIDDSGFATFRKSASNDIFISATYGELGMTKDELVAWYKENMVDGGGSDITSGDVQNMIDESISGKADSSAVTEEISAAVSGKQDTLIAGENITISGNVISAEGGGKAVSGGTNISITTGETADTISCTIPAYRSGSSNGISLNYNSNTASGSRSLAGGSNCKATSENAVALGYNSEAKNDNAFAMGQYSIASGFCSAAICREAQAKNMAEFACGQHNVSNKANDTFGNSGNTLFSVGNGTSDSARHNAFEIRQNGDIYITSGGTDIKLQDNLGGGNNVVELTQAEYDALVSGGTVDPTAFYIITDAVAFDPSTKVDTSAFTAYSAATDTALSGKVDTSTFNIYSGSVDTALSGKQDTLSAGTGIEISGNVISATGGGGGKAVSAGTNISITTGETADTINCTLPISADSKGIYTTSTYPFLSSSRKSGNVVFGYNNILDTFGSTKNSNYNLFFGSSNSISVNGSGMLIGGLNNINSGNYSDMTACVALGSNNLVGNPYEFASGRFNVTHFETTSFGNSGNTLFSVGNGTADNARHNAFEIRQNGDIYLTKDGQDVKLQDQLGGGEVSSAITSGDTNAVAGGAVYDKFDEVEQVTAASLNALNDKFGGLSLAKLTQSEYNALSPNYDNNTLYVIVN